MKKKVDGVHKVDEVGKGGPVSTPTSSTLSTSITSPTLDGLVSALRAKHMPTLARAISLVENGRDGYEQLLSEIHPLLGRAHRIGITGPPGAGKSTLTERIIKAYRDRGVTVAVVAVDPTSPFTGGALLGDRIRMEHLALDPGVFIRSMATRGAVGGTAATTREVCDVLDAFGFDRIVIETVGVGQSELAIAETADTSIVVLVPESGDGIQVLKAGVMEIADIFVVNKADRPGADKLRQEIEIMLGLRKGQAFRHVGAHHRPDGRTGGKAAGSAGNTDRRGPVRWEPPVLATTGTTGEGIGPLIDAIEAHGQSLRDSGELERRRRGRLVRHTREVVERNLRRMVWVQGPGEAILSSGLDRMAVGELSPYQVAQDILAGLREGANNHGE